jgi:hypothetical protein
LKAVTESGAASKSIFRRFYASDSKGKSYFAGAGRKKINHALQ